MRLGLLLILLLAHVGASADATLVNPALVLTPLPAPMSETRRLQAFEVAPVRQRAGPGIAFGSPVGFGMSWGGVSLGAGLQEAPNDPDARFYGSSGIATGIGSPRLVAMEVSVGVSHLYELADSGSASVKLHHTFGSLTGVAVGAERVARWGLAATANPAAYAAVTQLVPLGQRVVLSLNAGARQVLDDIRQVRAFGGVAILLDSRISLIADHTGRDLNAGVSVVPFDRFPLSLTVGMTNVLEQDGFSRALVGSTGLGLKF